MKRALVVTACLLSSSISFARNDVFVHGRNQGPANLTDYWHNGGFSDNGVTAFTGNNAEGNYVYAYDATQSWSDLSASSRPVCALTQAMYNTPGTDMAVLGHSAGGDVAVYMLAVAQNGWANSCAISPVQAKAWATYVISIASPFRGSSVADAVYGQTSGNWFQQTCGSIAGSVANLLFNQTSNMTWALTSNMMNSNFNSLIAYGTYGSIYMQRGTSNKGDDSTGLWWAQYCSNLEGACGLLCTPSNDGFVSQNSSLGCVRGTSVGTNCMPYAHIGWSDAVGHSSSRRNDYLSYAANVWAHNPY